MTALGLHQILLYIQHSISFAGVLIILTGVIQALYRYLIYCLHGKPKDQENGINSLRLSLGRVLVLGLEFIVAADLIGTTTAPDYYSLGMVAGIVMIRTVLSFTLNWELSSIHVHKK